MAEEEALAKKLALGSSELRFLLVHHKVKDSFAIDPVASLRMRAQAAGVVVA